MFVRVSKSKILANASIAHIFDFDPLISLYYFIFLASI